MTKEMTIEQAAYEISDKKLEAETLIMECEELANKFNLDFNFSVTYGMGGWYSGADGEWNPSSQSC